MSDIAETSGLVAKFATVEKLALNLIQEITKEQYSLSKQRNAERLNALVESYQSAWRDFTKFFPQSKVTIDYVSGYDVKEYDYDSHKRMALLDRLIVNCETATERLKQAMIMIPVEERDKLDSLRKALGSIEINQLVLRHLLKAIDEYEASHYFAATLLAGKASVFILEQLGGTTDEEKVQRLIVAGLVNKDLKDRFLKSARRARNYFTHDISAIPEPVDALGLVSDACDLAIKWSQLRL